MQVIATIDACLVKFIVCKWFQEKKKDNSFRFKISALDEFKFECQEMLFCELRKCHA